MIMEFANALNGIKTEPVAEPRALIPSKRSATTSTLDNVQQNETTSPSTQGKESSKRRKRTPEPGRTKAKRVPKQAGGFVCSEPGCGKTFDFNGERTKHERIHKPKSEYPYGCDNCERRFIDKKDLKRHEKTHVET